MQEAFHEFPPNSCQRSFSSSTRCTHFRGSCMVCGYHPPCHSRSPGSKTVISRFILSRKQSVLWGQLAKGHASLLCILTSFWVLRAPKSWSNYFFSAVFNLFCLLSVNFCLNRATSNSYQKQFNIFILKYLIQSQTGTTIVRRACGSCPFHPLHK